MDRKEIVKRLGEHFGVEPKYMGVPSFAYQIETGQETYTVDRQGKITTDAGVEMDLETILGTNNNLREQDLVEFEVELPMDGYNGASLRNLVNILYSKQHLIKKALGTSKDIIASDFVEGINNGHIETLEDFQRALQGIDDAGKQGVKFDFRDKTIKVCFLEGQPDADRIKAYTQLVGLLSEYAKTVKHSSTKVKPADNEKYAFRVFLLRLGMIGDEYKVARKVLLENLDGNSAFKSGSKPEQEAGE